LSGILNITVIEMEENDVIYFRNWRLLRPTRR